MSEGAEGGTGVQYTEQVQKLEGIVEQLRQRGDLRLADDIHEIAAELREQTVAMELLTTGQAAALLGIGSINTIKRWVREGRLRGVRRGGRILIARDDVQRLVQAPAVAEQQVWERGLAEALAPFEEQAHDEPLTLGETWQGRKPWDDQGVGD